MLICLQVSSSQEIEEHGIRANIFKALGILFMLTNFTLFHFVSFHSTSYVADFLETIHGKRQSWYCFGWDPVAVGCMFLGQWIFPTWPSGSQMAHLAVWTLPWPLSQFFWWLHSQKQMLSWQPWGSGLKSRPLCHFKLGPNDSGDEWQPPTCLLSWSAELWSLAFRQRKGIRFLGLCSQFPLGILKPSKIAWCDRKHSKWDWILRWKWSKVAWVRATGWNVNSICPSGS